MTIATTIIMAINQNININPSEMHVDNDLTDWFSYDNNIKGTLTVRRLKNKGSF